MSGQVSLTLDLEVAKALQGLQSVVQKQQSYDQALIKTIGITRDQAKANAELVAQQKQSHELVTAFKKYEAELEQKLSKMTVDERDKVLKKSVEVENLIAGAQNTRVKNEIASERLIAGVREKMAKDEIDRAKQKQAADRLVAAGREQAAAEEMMRVQRSLQLQKGFIKGYAQEGEGLNKVLMTTSDYLKSVGVQQKETFGKAAIGDLVQLGAGYLTVGRSLQEIRRAMQEVRKEAGEALQLLKGRAPTLGELAQVAEGNTPEEIAADANKMRKEAETAAIRHGWNFGETLNVRKEARNSGADESFDEILRYAHLTRDPVTVAKAIGQFRFNFAGTGGENLGFKEIANEALAASQASPVDLKDIFTKLGSSSALAKNVGATSDEFMAYYSILARGMGNANEAADTLGLLLNKGQMKGFGGKGIAGIVDQLSAMSPEERADAIGERESINKAINIFGSEDSKAALAQQKTAVSRAKQMANLPNSPLEIRRQALAQSKEGRAVIDLARVEAAAEITKADVGISEAERTSNRLLFQA
jgi:hypothetical protein